LRIRRRITNERRLFPRTLSVISAGLIAQLTLGQQPSYEGTCSSKECHGKLLQRPVVHAPVESDCESCHESTSKEAHQFSLTETGSALCLDCHDEEGFEGKYVHGAMELDDCTACHDPHGGDTAGLLTADSVGKLCADCHEDTLEDLQFLHGPAVIGACTACHAPHASQHEALLISNVRELCLDCHDGVADRLDEAKQTHAPVQDSCVSCHNPHGADNNMMLLSAQPGLCLDCHDDIAETAESAVHRHSPVTSGDACATCHDAHASDEPNLIKAENSMKLCMSCHDQDIKVGKRTLFKIAGALDGGNPHGPIADGDCVTCHAPHGGSRASLLAHSFPDDFYSPFDADQYSLCFDCHDVEAFETADADATEFRNGDVNLHFLHVNKPRKGRSCRACHDPHGTKNPHHIVDRVPFGGWEIPVNFAPAQQGGTCQPGCHRAYSYDRETAVQNLPNPKGS